MIPGARVGPPLLSLAAIASLATAQLVPCLAAAAGTAANGAGSLPPIVQIGTWPGYARADAYSVLVTNDLAYVAQGHGGLVILDVSDPAKPERLGGFNTDGFAYNVEVVGNLAYIADDTDGLQIIDVADPTKPKWWGSYDHGLGRHGFRDVQVVGNLAYVAGGNAGFELIDVSNPAIPALLGYCRTGGFAKNVHVVGNVACLADGENGLQIISVSDPANPTRLGAYDTDGDAHDVQVDGNLAYVADGGSEGLQIIDISDPSQPVKLGSSGSSAAYGVHVVDNIALVAAGRGGLAIVDVSNPASPARLGFHDTDGDARDVQGAGNLAYVAEGGRGLQIIDFSDLASPKRLGGYANPGYARRVQVLQGLAYVADGAEGLKIIDVSDPTNPTLIGGFETDFAYCLHVVGHLAYVGTFYRLQIVDVSDPTHPTLVSRHDMRGQPYSIQLVGNLAYIALDWLGLGVLDVSDPASPRWIGGFYVGGFRARDVQVAENLAYLTSGLAWRVLDVSDPANPVRLEGYSNAFPDTSTLRSVAFANSSADSDLQPLNAEAVARPSQPSVGNATPPNSLEVVGNVLYRALGVVNYPGLWTYDVSDPARPVRLNSGGLGHADHALARGVHVVGGHAHAAGDAGLQVFDVSDPRSLVLVAGYDTDGTAEVVQVVGNLAYVADGECGLVILRLPYPVILTDQADFGVVGDEFGFSISGPGGQTAVVEGSTDLHEWVPLGTQPLGDAPWHFSDPDWRQLPGRFYRVRME